MLNAALPRLHERAAARPRPRPAAVVPALTRFSRVWALDCSTLEALFRKVGLLHETETTVAGGKLAALLDVATKLPVQIWWDADATLNEKIFLPQVEAALPPNTLLLLDRGFTAFSLFDRLSETGVTFLTRARGNLRVQSVTRVLRDTPRLRDQIVRVGERHHPCHHPLRLIEVREVGGAWHGYLTNALDPERLPAQDVVGLYAQRWRIEEAFLLVKRLLGLSYLWTGAANGIALQVWATWLLYAVLVDLADDVAVALEAPLERISLEMTFRGLYHFCVARARGQTGDDPVAYLAAQTDLGILKARRPGRERARAARQAALAVLDTADATLTCCH